MDEKRRAAAAQHLAGLEKSKFIEHSRWEEYTKYAGALSMRKMLNKTVSPRNARKIWALWKNFPMSNKWPPKGVDFAKYFTSKLDDNPHLKIMPP